MNLDPLNQTKNITVIVLYSFPNQNLRQIGQGVPELRSVIQTKRNCLLKSKHVLIFTFIYLKMYVFVILSYECSIL